MDTRRAFPCPGNIGWILPAACWLAGAFPPAERSSLFCQVSGAPSDAVVQPNQSWPVAMTELRDQRDVAAVLSPAEAPAKGLATLEFSSPCCETCFFLSCPNQRILTTKSLVDGAPPLAKQAARFRRLTPRSRTRPLFDALGQLSDGSAPKRRILRVGRKSHIETRMCKLGGEQPQDTLDRRPLRKVPGYSSRQIISDPPKPDSAFGGGLVLSIRRNNAEPLTMRIATTSTRAAI